MTLSNMFTSNIRKDCNAGCRSGNALRPQLIHPRMCCHLTSGLFRDLDVSTNVRTTVTKVPLDLSDIEMVIDEGSTYKPIILRSGPKNGFNFTCGRLSPS